ncbi:energy transducer TonB [Cryomorphaceae bacterium 1068]|nr:energy transducer TonB [Cryomorphaceae bacterium 1068]
MKNIATIILFALALSSNGQSTTKLSGRNEQIDSLYKDGFKGYQRDFRNQIYYPSEIKPEGIVGRIYIEAVIDTVGQISDFKIMRGIDHRLDSIVSEKFKNTEGKWRILVNGQDEKTPYIIQDYIHFELR